MNTKLLFSNQRNTWNTKWILIFNNDSFRQSKLSCNFFTYPIREQLKAIQATNSKYRRKNIYIYQTKQKGAKITNPANIQAHIMLVRNLNF